MSQETSHAARSGLNLDPGLKSLVSWTVAQFGQVIRRNLGDESYQRVENLRAEMAGLRTASSEQTFQVLKREFEELRELSRDERRAMALAFALMLETINVCENAYRSHRLTQAPPATSHDANKKTRQPAALTYVLTAHPTEARAPANIAAFHELQRELIQILRATLPGEPIAPTVETRERVTHALEIAWQTPLVRDRQPRVKDEAENIYANVLRDEAITAILDLRDEGVPISLRTWVGGDKDGHPGVDETTLLASLTLSRTRLLEIAHGFLNETRATLERVPGHPLTKDLVKIQKLLPGLRSLKIGDAKKITTFMTATQTFCTRYQASFGALHPSLHRLNRLGDIFPALVVPLELRESSDVLMSGTATGHKLAIVRMLRTLEKISRGGSPLGYARGLIVSMTEKIEHLQQAARLQHEIFGTVALPVIPLFEEASSLAESPQLVQAMIDDPKIGRAARTLWNGQLEIMVGYSDSAKEAGVLASRMAIAKALPILEGIVKDAGLKPIFFHGSGGSVDRGGGSIEDQTAWWPRSALDHYKVTIQGEMVERSFSTRAITLSQIRHILSSAGEGLNKGVAREARTEQSPALQALARAGSRAYRERIGNPEFLELVEKATPYMYLSALKIGSRPSKRAAQLQVSGLRAIPWILCWTQSRILFPTWWGVGHAWGTMNAAERKDITTAYQTTPAFTSYVKALGFTLAKIEFAVWRLAIEQSRLSAEQKTRFIADFAAELEAAKVFFHAVTAEKNFVWFRPWLADSIHLRSAMIHPLNLLQFLAETDRDNHLLRLTVTGISSGMMTTG